MKQSLLTIAGVVVVALEITNALVTELQAQVGRADVDVPIYHDLGNYHYAISSTNDLVQQYFNQGIRLYYAFNHAEAIRAFRAAQRIDPDCAICWWGEALAWGPNINLAMDQPSAVAAFSAIQKAVSLRNFANSKEQSLIEALAVRYTKDAPEDRAHLDQAYVDALSVVVNQYPHDLDIAVLYAEAIMDLRPWNYWDAAGEPQPGIELALGYLQQVLSVNEYHPGACHFYIHAVEAVHPERAVPCAERLANLMPGAGHLVHMPGHIYIRVGRYLEAVTANEHAVHADETFIQDQHPGMGMYTVGYYPHNYDFLAFAAMMIGQSKTSIDSANKVTSLLPAEMFGSAGMDFLQHWLTRPLQMHVRFAQWEDILKVQQPSEQYPHSVALWHYARGRALIGMQDMEAAKNELRILQSIAANPDLQSLKMEFNQSSALLALAEQVLNGWMEAADGNFAKAIVLLQNAVELEEELLYGEPPEWSVPVRQELGEVLLLARRYGEAELTFKADLEKFPENGWSLHGLLGALEAQGKTTEASQVRVTLDRVWSTADVALEAIF